MCKVRFIVKRQNRSFASTRYLLRYFIDCVSLVFYSFETQGQKYVFHQRQCCITWISELFTSFDQPSLLWPSHVGVWQGVVGVLYTWGKSNMSRVVLHRSARVVRSGLHPPARSRSHVVLRPCHPLPPAHRPAGTLRVFTGCVQRLGYHLI